MGLMSIIEKAKVSSNLTCSIIPLSLKAIILISLIKVLTTDLSRPALVMKIL